MKASMYCVEGKWEAFHVANLHYYHQRQTVLERKQIWNRINQGSDPFRQGCPWTAVIFPRWSRWVPVGFVETCLQFERVACAWKLGTLRLKLVSGSLHQVEWSQERLVQRKLKKSARRVTCAQIFVWRNMTPSCKLTAAIFDIPWAGETQDDSCHARHWGVCFQTASIILGQMLHQCSGQLQQCQTLLDGQTLLGNEMRFFSQPYLAMKHLWTKQGVGVANGPWKIKTSKFSV